MSKCKYYKQKKQVSYDSGQTWSDVSPAVYQVGNLYEMDSLDCTDGEIITNWIVVPGDYFCEGKSKYEKEIAKYSTDGGNTWKFYYPSLYRFGRLLEVNSTICNNKWEGYYYTNDDLCGINEVYVEGVGCVRITVPSGHGGTINGWDPVKYIRCSTASSTTLTKTEVSYSPYILYEGIIGDCCSRIDTECFYNCTSFSSCTIGSGVTSIGNYAFGNCTSLEKITIPDSVTSIGQSAFDNCTGLTSCTIGSGVTSIGYGAFRYCTGLTSLVIPDSVTSLDSDVFQDCYGLTTVTIGSGITSLNSTFAYCNNLRTVTCLATTPPTQDIAFLDCPLEHIYVPCDSLTYYLTAWSSYANIIEGIPPCNTPLQYKLQLTYSDSTSYNLLCDTSSGITSGDTRPNGYTASAMTSAIIDGCINITTIGDRAFSGFTSLSSVTIPESITSIGNNAFRNCTGLTTLTIGSGITNIADYAFRACSSLSQVTIKASTPPSLGWMALPSNITVIYVPAAAVTSYKQASGWSDFSSRIQAIP